MRARSFTVGIALLAAAAAFLALLLLAGERGGEEPVPPDVDRKDASPKGVDVPVRPARALPGIAPQPGEPEAAVEGPSLEVRVLLAGVEPVAGCPVMGAERDADGGFLACIEEGGPESGNTDGEGLCVLRWTREPAERLLAVFIDRDARVDKVEGAEVVGHLREIHPVLRAGTDPVVVYLHDREGIVRLRLLDERTGRPIEATSRPVLEQTLAGAPGREEVHGEPLRHSGGAWWQPPPFEASEGPIVLRLAGYRDLPLAAEDLEGRRTLRLAPSGTGVRGTLDIHVTKEITRLEALLLPIDGAARGTPARMVGEIRGPGPFLLDGLPPGEWELEIRFHVGRMRLLPGSPWAVRRFRYEGGELDLGVLRPGPGVALRARWIPGNRDVPEGARLVLALIPFEGGGDIVSYQETKDRRTVAAATIVTEGTEAPDGWTLFEDLKPGGEYLVLSPEVPGWRETVRAPSGPDEAVTHEAGRDLRLAKCRFTFVNQGKKPEGHLILQGPFRARDFDGGKCVLEASLPPGRHRFSGSLIKGVKTDDVWIRAESFQSVHAEVDVPDAPSFEATVELRISEE